MIADLGNVDILVNNAGQSAAMPFLKVSDEAWQADLDVKLFALFDSPVLSGRRCRQTVGDG